jgi:DNA-binding NarL/FixJ family response regulator
LPEKKVLTSVDKQINVLIADHQKNSRRGLRALLEFSWFINQIWEARDGEAAIKVIIEIKPDLVIIDLNIPVIGALCVTRWIRHYWPDIKIIILSMYPHYEEEVMAAGADRYLVKGQGDYSIQDEILSLFPTVSGGIKGSYDPNQNKKAIKR